jgi:hypothetical protein
MDNTEVELLNQKFHARYHRNVLVPQAGSGKAETARDLRLALSDSRAYSSAG